MYSYTAELVRVLDGDTVELKVDCGFKISYVDKFRLAHIDAPERGKEATDALTTILKSVSELRVETIKPDKYGRWLVIIYLPSGNTVNDWMVHEGYAVPYEGGAK